MNENIVNYSYKGKSIPFSKQGSIWVNLTKMGRPFRKKPAQFLKSTEGIEFISALETTIYDVKQSHIIKTVRGHRSISGTWAVKELAIEFARWLSPEFSIWTNQRIMELLQDTYAPAQPKNEDSLILRAMNILNARVEEQKLLIKELKPKADTLDHLSATGDMYNMGSAAKLLSLRVNGYKTNKGPLGSSSLYDFLRDEGYIIQGSTAPKQQYVDSGYFTVKYTRINGKLRAQTMVTAKGIQYLIRKYHNHRISA